MEFLETFNRYYRYVYIPIGIALAGAFIYLLVSAVPLLKTLKSLTPGLSRMTGTLGETKKKADKVKTTMSYAVKGLVAALSGLAFLHVLKRIFAKGEDDQYHVVDNLKTEVGRLGRNAGAKRILNDVGTIARSVSGQIGK